jgi:type IV pilus assembly protein PilA
MHDFRSNFNQREERAVCTGSKQKKHWRNMNRNNRTRRNQGFTIVELIVVVTVIGLLAVIAVGAYNKVVNDAKVAKSNALINTLATAKSLFVADPNTTPGMIAAFNGAPDSPAGFLAIAPYIRVNGTQPADVGTLKSLSGMPASVAITLGTVDDSSFNPPGGHTDTAPTVTGYGL